MDKSNLYAISAVVALTGFIVGRWDAKSHGGSAPAEAPAAAAPAAPAEAPAASPTPAEPTKPEAPAPTPEPAAAAPTAPSAPSAPSSLDAQSDEGAGKAADVAKIGTSPKSGNAFLGAKDPLVIVNVFSDFQCPVCKRSADPIKQLALDFPGKVKIVFRNNALEMHGRSKPAALAALAAKNQGKFWQYHDKLFFSGGLDDSSLRKYAEELKLDLAQWDKDIADPKSVARLKDESGWAEKMGAQGTPAFFVNGVRQVGWGSYLALKSMVDREVQAGEQLVSSGTPKAQVVAARVKATADKNTKNEGESAIDSAAWAKMLTAE